MDQFLNARVNSRMDSNDYKTSTPIERRDEVHRISQPKLSNKNFFPSPRGMRNHLTVTESNMHKTTTDFKVGKLQDQGKNQLNSTLSSFKGNLLASGSKDFRKNGSGALKGKLPNLYNSKPNDPIAEIP